MSDQPIIQVSFPFSLQTFLEGQAAALHVCGRPKGTLLGVVDVRLFAAFVGCVSILRLAIDSVSGLTFSAEFPFLLFLIAIAVLVLMQPWFQTRTLTRHFQRRPDRDQIMQFRIDSDGVMTCMGSTSTSSSAWTSYQKIVRTRKGFLFYLNDTVYQWLPNSAFSTSNEIELLTRVARQSATTYIERL